MSWSRTPTRVACGACGVSQPAGAAIRWVGGGRYPRCVECAQRLLREAPPADLPDTSAEPTQRIKFPETWGRWVAPNWTDARAKRAGDD